jgi:alkylhydroperoxidase family enzyme
MTRISEGVSQALFAEVRQHFSEKERVDFTWAVVARNGWNRIALSSRVVPGTYTTSKMPH